MIKLISIGFILSFALTFVSSAGEHPVAIIDLARAKSLALDACTKKYSGTDRNALQYCGLTATADTNDQVVVTVTYLLNGTGKSEKGDQDGFEIATTKQTTYVVKMDCLGNVTDTSSGMSIKMTSNGKKISTNKPSDATR